MPMIHCADCGKEMSDAAPACPHCGKPNTTKTDDKRSVGIWLGIGILILPIIFAWFTLRKGHTVLARVVSFAWLIISIAAYNVGEKSKVETVSTSNQKVQETVREEKKKEQAIQVDITKILSDYKNNEVAADNRYKGKLVEVTGLVDDIKKGLMDDLYVTIGTGEQFEIPQIQAFFDDEMNSQLSQLNKGELVTVVCRVDGLMMNVLLKDCSIR